MRKLVNARNWVLALTLLTAQPLHALQPEARTYNVVFIIADDLRCQLGCYGDVMAHSPNLDRLAKRGMRFDRAYCQYPVCNPTRTSVLTGLRPDTTRVLDNATSFRKHLPDVVTLPELFRKNGYEAISLGKVFHRGLRVEDVKAEMDDPRSWDPREYPVPTPRGTKGEGRNLTGGTLAWCRWLAAEGTDEDQADGQIAAKAVEVIQGKRDKPFFLAVGFNKPHDPFIAPKKYFDLYPLEKLKLAHDPVQRSKDVPLALPKGYDFTVFTEKEQREFLRAYLAGVSFMDAQVGKVLDAIERQKLWDTTIVVFWGDHGYHLGERGWWNKNTLFELSARAPLLVYTPGMKATGKVSDRLVEFVDIYPTITELCGLKSPEKREGISFRPLLDNPTRPWKKAAFTQVQRGKIAGRTVRSERYRYTIWEDGKQGIELYDHQTDPGEYRNLAYDAAHAATRKEMQQLLDGGWQAARPR